MNQVGWSHARRALARAVARTLAALGALGALAAPVAAQPAQSATRGVVTGRVVDAATQQPIPSAQVGVTGTTLGVVTGADGRYTIRGVPAGTVTLRVLRVGFAEDKLVVTVAAGQTATADFAMRSAAVSLTPVVTTATGQERRVEIGNAIGQVNAADLVQQAPISNVADLLTARTPGVQVLPGTSTGAGARVRIRGVNSLSLSNDPVYVIDGVRMTSTSGSSSISAGGTLPSRTGDLNPEEIETIEVVRGPSAATLYGTDAANGVIVITTKRGRAGRTRWNGYTEQGVVTDESPYPDAWSSFGHNLPSNAATRSCYLGSVARGLCVQDSVRTFNLFKDDETTPLAPGYRRQYGLQASGGSEAVRFFFSGETESEDGRYRMPTVFQNALRARGLDVREEWLRPNALAKYSGRANVTAALSPQLDLTASAGYVKSDWRVQPSDNNTIGLLSNALGGPGIKYNTLGADTLYGYRTYTPDRMFQETVDQGVDRFLGAANASWRPRSWLAARGNFGLDYTGRRDTDICRFSECVQAFEQDLGFKTDNRARIYQYTADVNATASFAPWQAVTSKTTVGAQYFRSLFDRNGASGAVLSPGGTTVSQTARQTAEEVSAESRTLGAFVEQSFGIRDRLFVTGAIRTDDNSAFGADFKAVVYPKASVSWVLSDEPFLGKPSWLDQLRLRTAWGASGVQPGTTDAARFFIGRTVVQDEGESGGLTFGSLGNSALKPEYTQEVEAGLDATLFGGRLTAEVTHYRKSSRDALVQRILPGSSGTDSTVVFANLGRVTNRGWEALLTARPVALRAATWNVSVNASTNANRLVDLGGVPPIIGTTIDERAGYPLNGYWQRHYTYADANGDGVLSRTEVQVDTARSFLGYSIPRHEVAVTNALDLVGGKLRLSALVDHKGGHKLYNNTERIRCASRNNCRGLIDPAAPLDLQARVIALRETANQSLMGFIEDASFWRLREVAVILTAPDTWARRLVRARTASLQLSARNLAIWTNYTGIDPESNYNLLSDVPADFQTAAPARYLTLRLDLGF
jgi:TonB-linked SusC/RagA family outer membrane protein